MGGHGLGNMVDCLPLRNNLWSCSLTFTWTHVCVHTCINACILMCSRITWLACQIHKAGLLPESFLLVGGSQVGGVWEVLFLTSVIVYSVDVWIRCLNTNGRGISSGFDSVHCQMFNFPVLIPAFITVILLLESPFTHFLAPQSPCWPIQQGLPEQEDTCSNHWIRSKTQYCVYIGNLKRQASWFKLKGVFSKIAYLGAEEISQSMECLPCKIWIWIWVRPPRRHIKEARCGVLLVFSAMGRCRQAAACNFLVSQLSLLGEL